MVLVALLLFIMRKKKNIEVHQIDLPRISTENPIGWYSKILKILSLNGMIKDNENIFDLRTGGTIPFEKYQGWMIDKINFFYKKRFMYIGDASKIISLMNEKFDFILVDAMKNPGERLSLLSAILKNSKSNFCIIQDGGWVNDAFENFCEINKLELFNYGKIQFTFKK